MQSVRDQEMEDETAESSSRQALQLERDDRR